MSKKQKNKQSHHVVTVAQQLSYSGPLPHPNHFQQYENILPGAADRILKQAESQTTHRQSIEKKVIDSNIFNERLGIFLNFLLSLCIIAGGFLIVILSKNAWGYVAILGTPLLSGGIFLGTKYIEKKKVKEDN